MSTALRTGKPSVNLHQGSTTQQRYQQAAKFRQTKNPYEEDLLYLMGGERRDFDVCDYPRLKERIFRFNGQRQLVEWEDL